MSLIARGGSLLVGSDGKLTTNEDCCCGECDCTTFKFGSFGQCDCITEAYGDTLYGRGDATINITGSLTPFPVLCGFDLVTPSSCLDIAGSYLVPLDVGDRWWVHVQYVCTVPSPPALINPQDQYLVTTIRVRSQCSSYLFQPTLQNAPGVSLTQGNANLSVSVVSRMYNVIEGESVPYTTFTGPLTSGELNLSPLIPGVDRYFDGPTERSTASERIWRWLSTFPMLDDYLYLPSSTCPAHCNTVTERNQCISGAVTPDDSAYYDSDRDSCGMSGLTITGSQSTVAL